MPKQAFISLGSNIEPEKYLQLAIDRLGALGELMATSSVYQSPAVGAAGQPDFLNAAALVATDLSPHAARDALRAIEEALGRIRDDDKFAPRIIDLDLCLLGNLVLDSSELTLPHPEILTQAYIAVPLAELSPQFAHPLTGEPLAESAKRLREKSQLIHRADLSLHNRCVPRN